MRRGEGGNFPPGGGPGQQGRQGPQGQQGQQGPQGRQAMEGGFGAAGEAGTSPGGGPAEEGRKGGEKKAFLFFRGRNGPQNFQGNSEEEGVETFHSGRAVSS